MESWANMLRPMFDVRMPASGNVLLNYHPWTNWGWSDSGAGDPEMEDAIFRQVGLPGKQLGQLTDAVLLLIKLAEQESAEDDRQKRPEAFTKLEELAAKIEAKKLELKKTAEGEARTALDHLRRADKDAFEKLIDEQMASRAAGAKSDASP